MALGHAASPASIRHTRASKRLIIYRLYQRGVSEATMSFSPELIMKVVEKSVGFLNARTEGKRAFFEKVIAPLYEETQRVVDDYHALWREVIPVATEMAGSPWIDPSAEAEMRKQVEDQRERNLIARRKLHGIATGLESNDDLAIQEFGRKMNKIFVFQTDNCAGVISEFGRFCDLKTVDPDMRLDKYQARLQLALAAVDEKRRDVQKAWIELSKLYAELQLRAYAR